MLCITLIDLSVGYMNCLHLFVIVNNAAMNIGVQASIPVPVFNTLGYIPQG